MFFKDVAAVRYGVLVNFVNGIKANTSYVVGLKDVNGIKLNITFVSMLGLKKEEIENKYDNIVDALWYAVTSRLVTEFYETLKQGGSFTLKNIETTPLGFNFRKGWFVKKNYFVPWEKTLKVVDKGFVRVYSNEKKRIGSSLRLIHDWNGVVFHALMDWLWKEGRVYGLAENKEKKGI